LNENPDLRSAKHVTLLDVLEGGSPDYAIITMKPGGAWNLKDLEAAFAQRSGLRQGQLAERFENRLLELGGRQQALTEETARISKNTLSEVTRLHQIISELNGKIESMVSDIHYMARRSFFEKLFFHSDGKPVKLVRRLLFHTSGELRRLFRRLVLHKKGTPRRIFSRWMQSSPYGVAKYPNPAA
jgi:hypothetical protein